jgi:hypothetical protein
VNWESFDLEPLTDQLRRSCEAHEAERMVYAFERAVAVARIDPELLSHLFRRHSLLACTR